MWGSKLKDGLKDWVREHFATKYDTSQCQRDCTDTMHKLRALYDYLGLEYQYCPGREIVVKKGGKGCQP